MRSLLLLVVFAMCCRGAAARGSITIYTDLSAKPFANVTRWTHKEFYGDHSNRQPTQPPREWSNFTYLLSPNTTGVQLTSAEGIPVPERVVHWEILRDVSLPLRGNEYLGILEVGVVWWGKSWRLYLGCI